MFDTDTEQDITAAEYQYISIHLNKLTNVRNTQQFRAEVNEYEDASRVNSFKLCYKFTTIFKVECRNRGTV